MMHKLIQNNIIDALSTNVWMVVICVTVVIQLKIDCGFDDFVFIIYYYDWGEKEKKYATNNNIDWLFL